jgi:DNA polymerase
MSTERAIQALRMKQSIAYASIKKVATMMACAGPYDNRIRGMLNHHGATTGRWTASLVQFQNMKRPTIKHSEEAYRDICNGVDREMLELCYGPTLEVIGSCIRHFVHDCKEDWTGKLCPSCEGFGVVMRDGEEEKCNKCGGSGDKWATVENPLLDADYSAIEARIVCWLAGQQDALDEYRQGVDRYVNMASLIYGVHPEEVTKFPQRFIGKQTILGCGFGMGKPKFRGTCEKLGYKDMPLGLEDTAVDTWRAKHKKVVSYWYDVERFAKRAILHKGEPTFMLRGVGFHCRDIEGIPFLLIRLPSGRHLAYPHPRIKSETKSFSHQEESGGWITPAHTSQVNSRIVFFGHILGTQWGDVETWGGKLVENITQAVAADIMATGAHNAENAGYEIATLIHDQALAYHQSGQTAEEFVRLLTTLPAWADGLPVAAEGGIVPFYRKD